MLNVNNLVIFRVTIQKRTTKTMHTGEREQQHLRICFSSCIFVFLFVRCSLNGSMHCLCVHFVVVEFLYEKFNLIIIYETRNECEKKIIFCTSTPKYLSIDI